MTYGIDNYERKQIFENKSWMHYLDKGQNPLLIYIQVTWNY